MAVHIAEVLDMREAAVRRVMQGRGKGRIMTRLFLIIALLWPAIANAEQVASSSTYVVDSDTVHARNL